MSDSLDSVKEDSAKESPASVSVGLGELLLHHNEIGDWSTMVNEQMAETASQNKETPSSQQKSEQKQIHSNNSIKSNSKPLELHGPPFYASIHSLPYSSGFLDLFYFFGGETKVKDIIMLPNLAGPNVNRFSGNCLLELFTFETLVDVLKMNSKDFFGRKMIINYVNPYNHNRQSFTFQELESAKLFTPPPFSTDRAKHPPDHQQYGNQQRTRTYNQYPSDGRQNHQYGYKTTYNKSYSNFNSNLSNDVRQQNRPAQTQVVRNPHHHPYSSTSSSWDQPSSSTRSSTAAAADRLRDNETGADVAAPPVKVKPVKNEDIFGAAKPVDTLLRQREIEEKMEKERLSSQQTYQNNNEAGTNIGNHYNVSGGGYSHSSSQYYHKNIGGGGYHPKSGSTKSHHNSNVSLHSIASQNPHPRGNVQILKSKRYSQSLQQQQPQQQQQLPQQPLSSTTSLSQGPVPLNEVRPNLLTKKDSLTSLHSTKTAINNDEWGLLEEQLQKTNSSLQNKQQKHVQGDEKGVQPQRKSIHSRIERLDESGNQETPQAITTYSSSNRQSFAKRGGHHHHDGGGRGSYSGGAPRRTYTPRNNNNNPTTTTTTIMGPKKEDSSNADTPAGGAIGSGGNESRAPPKIGRGQIDAIKNHIHVENVSVKSESSTKCSVSSNPTLNTIQSSLRGKMRTFVNSNSKNQPIDSNMEEKARGGGGYRGGGEKKHSTEGPTSLASPPVQKMRSDSMPIVFSSSNNDEFVEKATFKKQLTTAESPSTTPTTAGGGGGGETTPKTKSGSGKPKKKPSKAKDTGVTVPIQNKYTALQGYNEN